MGRKTSGGERRANQQTTEVKNADDGGKTRRRLIADPSLYLRLMRIKWCGCV